MLKGDRDVRREETDVFHRRRMVRRTIFRHHEAATATVRRREKGRMAQQAH
jgi:hypothetical protein